MERSESPNLVIVDGHAWRFAGVTRVEPVDLKAVDAAIAAVIPKRERVAGELERLRGLRLYKEASLITANDNRLDEAAK